MRKILVIGASNGDASLAGALAGPGRNVAVIDPWATGSTASAGTSALFPVDIGDREALFETFKMAVEALGGLDTMVVTAANDAACQVKNSARNADPAYAAWHDAIMQILYGGFHATQAALRHMIAQRAGTILYICADDAVDGQILDPAIAASTCGLLALSSSLAASAFRHGVNMNAIVVGSPFPPIEAPPDLPSTSEYEGLAYVPRSAFAAMRQQALFALEKQNGLGWHESVVAMINHLSGEHGGMIAGATLRLANVSKRAPWIRWSY